MRRREPVEITPAGPRPHSVLVTGAHGLVGSWLTAALVAAGGRVVVIRRDERAVSALDLSGITGRIDTVRGDICDDGLVARTLNEYEVDSVFHLAGQSLIATAAHSPLSTFEANVRGTWMLLEACRAADVRGVIVASSVKAYGPPSTGAFRESDPLAPALPYDVSKAAADLIAQCYWHTFRLPVAITRFSNVYGGGDVNRSRLVPEAVSAALAGRSPVIRSDGSPERDFLYVEDAVAAYLALWRAVLDGQAGGEAFNAGGGRSHRVRDVVDLICRLAGGGVTPEIEGGGTPPGEIDRQWVDATKLRELTGWAPAVDLVEGLRRTIDWYREHPQALSRAGTDL
jgi:CDP-glucose 4,6-dehydratase